MSQLSRELELQIIRKAYLSRRVDEQLLELFSKGKLFGTVHTCVGQEMSGATLAGYLQDGDSVFSNHRCHGHFISWKGDTRGLIAELMGKQTGVCGGLGGSQHLCKDGFYSNGVQGSIAPVSLGLAFARKLKAQGKISVVFVGDGTLGEGALYESLNIASKWALPLLFVVENNGYAQSTASHETLAGDICARAQAFGIRSFHGDTWDWRNLWKVYGEATAYVRGSIKPAFVRVDTYRLKAHSKGDDTRRRSEVAEFERKDPLNLILGENDSDVASLVRSVDLEVSEAIAAADAAPFAKEIPTRAAREKTAAGALEWRTETPEKKRQSAAINDQFKTLMRSNPALFFIGEDVLSPYGGAFKISQGLSDDFPGRVLNTPISEGAIVGLGAGMALEGYRPFVEIMFGDFITLTVDQLVNSVSKFEQMYNGQVEVNLVVRTPMGGGRGYGPTHSQTLERILLGTPGLRVVALNNLVDPKYVYGPLAETSVGPTLLIENKIGYTQQLRSEAPAGFRIRLSNESFPTVHLQPLCPQVDVSLIGYGGVAETLVQTAEKLFESSDVVAQAFCPTQIYPFDIRPYLPSLADSRAIVLVEEGQGFANFSAEFLAQLAEYAPELSSRVTRVHSPAAIIPASGPLELSLLPDVERVASAVQELLR